MQNILFIYLNFSLSIEDVVSCLTSSTDRACWLMLSISTITPKLRPKYVVSMMMLAFSGSG